MKSGAHNTYFWVDPQKDLFGIFMIRLCSLTPEIYRLFSVLATQANID
ncbi:hypothetical protein ACFL4V_00555 [Candidatus Latescibacterota bacterium]